MCWRNLEKRTDMYWRHRLNILFYGQNAATNHYSIGDIYSIEYHLLTVGSLFGSAKAQIHLYDWALTCFISKL